ncbi:hypothetical protein BGAFAR04_Ab0074 (plasmid) [Borreliella garinii Far04]|nr:hypothetical protein BGAFAR04_Ab0074 [Borreliella garinii Far04]
MTRSKMHILLFLFINTPSFFSYSLPKYYFIIKQAKHRGKVF